MNKHTIRPHDTDKDGKECALPPPLHPPPPAPPHNIFSQGKNPGQSLLRNANHATQNDSSSQNTFHLSSSSHPLLNHFRQASLNGNPKLGRFSKPPNSAHMPPAASGEPEPSFAAFSRANTGPRMEKSTAPRVARVPAQLPPWPSGPEPGAAPIPAGRSRPEGLGASGSRPPGISAPRWSGRPPRSPPGARAHTWCSQPAHTGTRTLTWSGGHLRTPPLPRHNPLVAAGWPAGATRTPGSGGGGTLTPPGCPSQQRGRGGGGC